MKPAKYSFVRTNSNGQTTQQHLLPAGKRSPADTHSWAGVVYWWVTHPKKANVLRAMEKCSLKKNQSSYSILATKKKVVVAVVNTRWQKLTWCKYWLGCMYHYYHHCRYVCMPLEACVGKREWGKNQEKWSLEEKERERRGKIKKNGHQRKIGRGERRHENIYMLWVPRQT